MKPIIWLIKKSELLSALSIRLVYLSGKSKVPIHPKHLINDDESLYKKIVRRGDVVLDVGCGSGQYSNKVAKIAKKVIGIDKDSRNLEVAWRDASNRRIMNVEYRLINVEKKLPFRDEMFDVVLLIDVLEHIKKKK